ncbi:hypothetical protein [Mycobacterium sp.]|uniref:hypothetical protein n=1 Tax=Mycobacterium sp. TaxID=1785 RepID=UPI002BC1B8F6|nr:hypothetical protein [Mycobacterium sp.]HXB87552.1 hypothetical protein [Mycobacterium sp.]
MATIRTARCGHLLEELRPQTELIDVLRRHDGPESDVVVREVSSIERLWSGKTKQFDAR